MRVAAFVLGTICIIACDRGSVRAARTASNVEPTTRGFRGADCARQGTDSARAVCAALQAIDSADASHLPQRLESFVRRGNTICIITFPESANVLDGEGRAIVIGGHVSEVALTDSAGCGGRHTDTLPQHPLQF
jgi:hypothetical protein